MTRRFLGVSEPVWRVLIAGGVAGIWMLVAWTATAYANDCAAYVNDPKNFTGNLQGLIEDCMRTGYVQAVTTLLVGGVGGGGIAIAVNKGLKDAGKNAEPGDEEKNDGDTPEAPPPLTGRDTVPEPCRSRWDDYRKATEEEFQKGKDLASVTNWYHNVVNNHLGNLAKVTIQLGVDAADMASAGAGAIKGGMGVTKALLNLPETLSAIKNGLARAIAHSNGLETLIYNLFVEIGQLSAKGTRLAGLADDAGRLSTRAEERITEMIAGAAGLERDLAKYDELVRFSRSADSTMLERNGVSKHLLGAEAELENVNLEHKKILNRKQALEDWAAAERAAIETEDARAFSTKHEQLGTERGKLQKLQAENAEAAKGAHKEWQDKMGELSAAKKELEEARAAAAHLQKAKQEKILAEQDFRKAADHKHNAETRLKDAEAELLEFDKAAKEVEAAQDAVRKLQAEEADLAKRIDTIEKGNEAKKRYLDAEEARDHAADVVDEAGKEFGGLEAEIGLGEHQKKVDDLANAIHWRQKEWEDAYIDMVNKQAEYDKIMDIVGEGDDAVMRGRPPTKFETNQLHLAQNYEMDLRKALASEKTDLESAKILLGKAKADPRLGPAKMRLDLARHNLEVASGNLTGAERNFQRFDHPGIDLNGGPKLEAERTQVRADIKTKEYEAASKQMDTPRPEFEKKVAAAQTDAGQATQWYNEAETKLATADADLKTADLTGAGEPRDLLHTLEGQQARYQTLLNEQEALRARYEALKSGGDGPGAAAIKERIDVLEAELAKWKNPDFETEAARRNPAKYNEWKSEQGGLDRIGESQAKIATLEAKLTELRADLATVERKLSEQQAKTSGKSTDELESEKAKLAAELKEKQSALDTAKNEKKTQDQAKAQAEKEKEQADTDRKKKEAEKQKAEEEKRKSDEEIARYKRLQDNPVPPPEDVSWLGQKMHWVGEKTGIGQEWTPYHGSDAEAIGNKSHELRQKFDGVMDAITPDWLTWPFRKAGAKAGELFHKAFGGQSPEEVAAALKNGQKRVKEMEAQLKQVQEEFDALRKKAHEAKAALDQCCTINRPQAQAESN